VEHFFPNPTQFGSVRTFLVVDQTSSEDYVKVALPVKPNGQEGWIPRSEVEITTVGHRALVDLSDDSVTVWDGDEVIVDTKAVTGKPSTPTPVGVFYVRDVIAQPNVGGSYGPYILALSGFSEVLETFNGGLPALAIHGTNNPGQIGSERSSGCVRIPNDLITILADTVPLGTPVTIVA
jgi:lipoprotein-anchoring transpeptidase ErfK/SrfK